MRAKRSAGSGQRAERNRLLLILAGEVAFFLLTLGVRVTCIVFGVAVIGALLLCWRDARR